MSSNIATTLGATQLPGCGRPLDYTPAKKDPDYVGDLFPSALERITFEQAMLPMTTIREFMMLQLMNSITDKLDWNVKINNPEISAKWKEEALASSSDMTVKMVDWCLDELRHKASLIPEGTVQLHPVVVYNGDVVKSDNALSPEFKSKFQNAVRVFEEGIPEKLKDWHPGSAQKVWDLVHPSLFPLVYGRSRILENGEVTNLDDCIKRCGQGKILKIPNKVTDGSESEEATQVEDDGEGEADDGSDNDTVTQEPIFDPYSQIFQWLPCEVDISQDTSRITSYINNLHPLREKPLYNLIEKLIDECIPLWDLTLAPLRDPAFTHRLRIEYSEVEYLTETQDDSERETEMAMDVDTNADEGSNGGNDSDEEDSDEEDSDEDEGGEDENEDGEDQDGEGDGAEDEDGDDDDNSDDRESVLSSDTEDVVRPEPAGPFSPLPSPPRFSLREEYRKHGLQIIVKLANIELAPEKPQYDGGSWHIEGQINEHIVATALYYYSSSNITTSTLSFRQWFSDEVAMEINYMQEHSAWLPVIYGCERDGPSIQDVGSVETREGRLLTFPNILQHRVDPFKLGDPTKPGHRKIVALFLVDPNIKIISTAHVPCQRQDWWWEASQGEPTRPGKLDLPLELQTQVLEGVDFPFSLREAKELREELMKERKEVHANHSEILSGEFTISLCEH